MGPVRHKQLIQVLAFVVAIDMAIGVVAVYARGDRPTTVTAAAPLSQSGTTPERLGSAPAGTGGGILAGAQFRSRRRSTAGAEGAGVAAPGPAEAAAPETSSSTSAPTTGASGGSRPRATGSGGRAAPAPSGRPTTTATGPAQTPTTSPASTATTSGPGSSVTDVEPVDDELVDPAPSGGEPTATTSTTAPAGLARPSGPRTAKLTIGDRTGDTVVEGTTTPAPQPRADLVETQANYTAKALLLTAKTADTVQPKDDPRWVSESTFVSWELDTNRDGAIDYEVQFFFADGTLVAGVSRPGDADSQSACGAEAGQTADGYTVGIDPACIGNPASFAYRVTTYYDTDPAAENATDVVTDVAPDGSWSKPVSRP